jgi:hypothetical protein
MSMLYFCGFAQDQRKDTQWHFQSNLQKHRDNSTKTTMPNAWGRIAFAQRNKIKHIIPIRPGWQISASSPPGLGSAIKKPIQNSPKAFLGI